MSTVVGIDLGTSNSAIAERAPSSPSTRVVPIRQTASANGQADELLLPSALFVLPEGERSNEAFRLPWTPENPSHVVGRFARDRGALLPNHLVVSAKSWLCNDRIDRRQPVLPWGAGQEVAKYSPFDVSRIYLEHLKAAYEWQRGSDEARREPDAVVLTVPASFDEAARNLTLDAALAAGWKSVTLLEEPLAAVYAWIEGQGSKWRDELRVGDVILVVDVGGGTTDFSLVTVLEREGAVDLQRVSVGDHILLGGDNMDLAVAHLVRHRLEEGGIVLDDWQFLALVHAARGAKERLLGNQGSSFERIALPSRGAGLFDSVVSVDITKEEIEQIVFDGFFPRVAVDVAPQMARGALRELGLSYAADPAITKHLARFLRHSAVAIQRNSNILPAVEAADISLADGWIKPTALLFNGGVFGSTLLRDRIHGLLAEWCGTAPRLLRAAELDVAVARGAAYFGAMKASGEGVRIRAGLSRSYYIGIESSELAVPGIPRKMKGVCIAPQGIEEGSSVELSGHTFGLVVGEPVEFRLFSSNERTSDGVGTVVSDASRELLAASNLETAAQSTSRDAGSLVPVTIQSTVTEVGVLQIELREEGGEGAWRLDFNVRGAESGAS